MGRLTAPVKVLRIGADRASERDDLVIAEEPLELRIDGEPLTVTMRTPGHDVDLALGFLVAEGTIRTERDVVAARFCGPRGEPNTYNTMSITLRVPGPPARNVLTTSACGICGRTAIDQVRTVSHFDARADTLPVPVSLLRSLPSLVADGQRLYAQTGGLHAAALVTLLGEVLVVREDVGRHNAVDKVVGWALRHGGLPRPGTVLYVSGRAGFELVQKAHVAGITTLAAVSAPSSLAVQLAREAGMTLVGFLRGETMNVYAGAERIDTSS